MRIKQNMIKNGKTEGEKRIAKKGGREGRRKEGRE